MLTFLFTNYEGENKPYSLSFAEKILETERYFSSNFDILIDQNGLPRKIRFDEKQELPSIVIKILSGLTAAFIAFESGSYIAPPICYIGFRFTTVVITDLVNNLHNRFNEIEYRIIRWPLQLLSLAANISILVAGLVLYLSCVFKFLGLDFKNNSYHPPKTSLKVALVALAVLLQISFLAPSSSFLHGKFIPK